MSLTVPKAGVVAGVAARAPAAEAGQTGDMVAGLGQRMLEIGVRIEREREERGLGRARVEMMRGLNDLQTRYQQVGDPDQIDQGYAADAAALRTGIVDALPARAREQAGQMFDELNVSHATAAGRRAVQLRQSQETATIMATGEEVVRTVATGDADTIAAASAQLDQQLQSAVARGVMTAEDAERTRQGYRDKTGQARATRMLSDDPQGLTAAIDAGEFAHMSGEQVQGWRARAVAAAQADAARAAAEADRAAKERVTAAEQVLKDGIGVFRTGRDFAGSTQADALLSDPAVAATPAAREYIAARALHQTMPSFATLPLPQKRAALVEAERGGIEKPYDNDMVTAMRAVIDADEKAFTTDPLTRAAEIGLTPPPALPDLSADPTELATGLRARAAYATSLVQQGYTDRPAYFTAEEREAWKASVGVDASPAEKARLAASLAAGLGPDADLAAAEIGADPVFVFVGGGLAHGLSPQLGRQIFEGQRVIEGKQVQLPSPAKRNQAFFGEFAGLFADGTDEGWTDQSGVRNQVIAAADALYAHRMRGKAVGGETDIAALDPEVYLQAAHEVMGGTGHYAGSSARGGVQTVRDHLVPLPDGVSADAVEAGLDRLGAILENPDPAAAAEAWKRIAASGNAPDLGGQPMDPRTLRSVSLRATGPDAYALVRDTGDGRLSVVMGDDDLPVQISLRELLRLGVAP